MKKRKDDIRAKYTCRLIKDTFLPLTKTDDAPDPVIIPPAESWLTLEIPGIFYGPYY